MLNKISLIIVFLLAVLSSSYAQTTSANERISQRYSEQNPTAHHKVALEVLSASKDWILQFNKGNAKACVDRYAKNATMSAMPFGVKHGVKEVSDFWTPFIASGATDLVYTNVSIEVANEKTVFLSANWSMNVGYGVIYQEKWEKIEGEWKYTYDDFQVLEQYKTPKPKTKKNPVGSHIVLEEMIRTSIEWTDGFNSKKPNVCGNGYTENATLNPVPFPRVNGKEGITNFWNKLAKDGATNLTYHNPIFKAITDNTAFLSSRWSMNIGEGKIYQEKWEKNEGQWLLTYDEFEVLKQY